MMDSIFCAKKINHYEKEEPNSTSNLLSVYQFY